MSITAIAELKASATTCASSPRPARSSVMPPPGPPRARGQRWDAPVRQRGQRRDPTALPSGRSARDRPVLGEAPDAGGDREAMPASPGSTTGRPVSTDRPVLCQSPTLTVTPTPRLLQPLRSPRPPPSPTPRRPTSLRRLLRLRLLRRVQRACRCRRRPDQDLPETASPCPWWGAMRLLCPSGGLALRATRKQHS